MTDKEIFLNADISMIPQKYHYEIELLGKEMFFAFISKFSGREFYFASPLKLTFIPLEHIDTDIISKIKLADLCDPYKRMAECIGIENLYKFVQNNSQSSVYIPKIKTIVKDIKTELIKNDFRQGKKIDYIVEKYNVSSKTARTIRESAIVQSYKDKETIKEISKKYNISEKKIEQTIEKKIPIKEYIK